MATMSIAIPPLLQQDQVAVFGGAAARNVMSHAVQSVIVLDYGHQDFKIVYLSSNPSIKPNVLKRATYVKRKAL